VHFQRHRRNCRGCATFYVETNLKTYDCTFSDLITIVSSTKCDEMDDDQESKRPRGCEFFQHLQQDWDIYYLLMRATAKKR
jgi:hypothetical protein